MNKYNDKISYLIENFTFQELSIEDKNLVLDNISEYEYEMYKKIIDTSRTVTVGNLPILPSSLKANVLRDYRHQFANQKTSYLKNTLAGLALLLVGAALGHTISHYKKDIKSDIQKPITRIDTIYIQTVDTLIHEIKSDPQIIIKEVIKTINTPIAATQAQQNRLKVDLSPSLDQKDPFTNIELDDLKPNKIGIPVREEPSLMNFLEVMPSDRLE